MATALPSDSLVSAADKEEARTAFDQSKSTPRGSPERIRLLEKASTLDPTIFDYKRNLAISYYYASQFDKCIETTLQAVKISSTDSFLFTLLGSAYHESQQYDKARDAHKESIRVDPNNLYALFNLALTLQAQNSPEALETWREYLRSSKDDQEQIESGNRENAQYNIDRLEKEDSA